MMVRPKFSKELLNMRRIQFTLAKSQNFHDADILKQKADLLQETELRELRANWSNLVLTRKGKLDQKQKNESDTFSEKRQLLRDKILRQRHHELETTVQQKFRNLRLELERQQHHERIQVNKTSILERRPTSANSPGTRDDNYHYRPTMATTSRLRKPSPLKSTNDYQNLLTTISSLSFPSISSKRSENGFANDQHEQKEHQSTLFPYAQDQSPPTKIVSARSVSRKRTRDPRIKHMD